MNKPFKTALVSANWTVWEQRLLSGALRYADSHPRIFVRVFSPLDDLEGAARQVVEWGANGAFGFFEHADLKVFKRSLTSSLPIVNCALAGPEPGVVTVLGDVTAFLEHAILHLRHLGLRNLALVVLEEGPNIRDRLVQPFLNMVQAPHPEQSSMVYAVDRSLLWNPEAEVNPVPAPLAAFLRSLPKPSGILTPQVGGGGYLIRCCKALGLRVPDQVAVVGSDDTDLSLASSPTLTSVLLSVETLGFEAMRVLAGLMAGDPEPPAPVRLRCVSLHVRESTGLRRPEICDIGAALECIRNQATRGITVEEVIRQTQRVSKVTFHRRFQESVGKSPAEAIRDRKLEEVRRLLTSTELPLEMISELCGFSSARVLSRVFRTIQGGSPRDFRRQNQGGNSPG